MAKTIKERINFFQSLCRQHQVKYLYAFGSSITDNFDEQKSDIDLLVEIEESDPLKRGEHLLSLWDSLEKKFDRKVDLLTPSSLSNPFLKQSIDKTKNLIYDASTEKVSV
ncbi:MAG: nucleotidyltransferase domain-containing protein [Balneolaceae bacterium]